MSRLLSRSFRDAISEKGGEPVGDPQLQQCRCVHRRAPIKYKRSSRSKPQIELRDYADRDRRSEGG